MPKDRTFKYALELFESGRHYSRIGWDTQRYGRINVANVRKYIAKLEESTQPGGCNEHLGPTKITFAKVYEAGQTKMEITIE